MRILFDVGVPKPLGKILSPPHEVQFAQSIGWGQLRNGELLKAAEPLFDVLISLDSNVPSQHQMCKYEIGFIVLRAWKNTISELMEMKGEIQSAVELITPGRAIGVFYDEDLFNKDVKKNRVLDEVFIYDL